MSDKGVGRTAPDTPGLVNILQYSILTRSLNPSQKQVSIKLHRGDNKKRQTYNRPAVARAVLQTPL